jgi:hypothetical protein
VGIVNEKRYGDIACRSDAESASVLLSDAKSTLRVTQSQLEVVVKLRTCEYLLVVGLKGQLTGYSVRRGVGERTMYSGLREKD